MPETQYDVIGIGNAIVDVLADTDDAFLASHGLAKGSMTLIDEARVRQLAVEVRPRAQASGGSAANTMAGIASLGGAAAFIGKVRDDAAGRLFGEDLAASGVRFHGTAASVGAPTGRCFVLVSPDAQRTMQTFLGSSANLTPADLDASAVAASRITYLEGYLFDPPPAQAAFLEAASIAHAAGGKVALSLSDAFCVDRHRDAFRELVSGHVDLLFANESEIVSLYEASSFDEAVRALGDACELAALTRGADGSVVVAGGTPIPVPASPASRVVDTTGAGDLYAAGFLYGLTRGKDPETCGRLGALAAAEVIEHYGARPEADLAERAAGVLS